MVITKRTTDQPGDPSASLLLTRENAVFCKNKKFSVTPAPISSPVIVPLAPHSSEEEEMACWEKNSVRVGVRWRRRHLLGWKLTEKDSRVYIAPTSSPSLSQVIEGCGVPRASHLYFTICMALSFRLSHRTQCLFPLWLDVPWLIMPSSCKLLKTDLRVAGRSRATRTSVGCSRSTGGEVRPGQGVVVQILSVTIFYWIKKK